MSSHSPVKPHVRRERARFEEIERVSRGELRERQSTEKHRTARTGSAATATASSGTGSGSPGRRPVHNRSKSASASSSSSTNSSSASPPQHQASPSRSDRPSTAGTQQTTPTTATYPNYYDYSENVHDIGSAPAPAPALLQTPKRNIPNAAAQANMAMQAPIQPQQQPPSQRLVGLPQQQPQSLSQSQTQSPSRTSSQSNAATPRQASGPTVYTTAQLQQAVARGAALNLNGNSNATSHTRVGSTSTRDRPPSYAGSSATDDIFPPNKVDLDAARYRHAQQAQSRASRDRSDRDRPNPPAKDLRDVRRASLNNTRPPSMNMGLPHRNDGRPASPESMPTPTGHNIRRLSTPSIPNTVLQPLDAKVVEYGTLMAEAQGEMARLDEEMRLLQDRQRAAEQRYLEAKGKHDDYRRQYSDVERALRGEFAQHGRDRRNGDIEECPVPPMPSMPNLQQYGVDPRQGDSRQASGMALNGNPGHAGMRSQRTVSIQSDMDNDTSRPGSKRGRFSRLFGV